MFKLEFPQVSFKHGYFVVTMISSEINDKIEDFIYLKWTRVSEFYSLD